MSSLNQEASSLNQEASSLNQETSFLNQEAYNPRNTNNINKLSSTKNGIPALLGSGEDAKNSIVYSLLKWIFGVGLLITIIFTVYDFRVDISIDNADKFLEHVKGIWGIFIPLITLSLGYIFGKSKD